MGYLGFLVVVVVIAALIGLLIAHAEQQKIAAMSEGEREKYLAQKRDDQLLLEHGCHNFAMVCPHCHSKGTVRTKQVVKKKGISGGKATAAVITGGISLFGTGLTRKEDYTQAYCDNCNNCWLF